MSKSFAVRNYMNDIWNSFKKMKMNIEADIQKSNKKKVWIRYLFNMKFVTFVDFFKHR